ncbi:MAG TPA: hypothetical protein VFW21_11970 [Mycobacterium sp.]|nr:hypothetical protein [Mycobacterium sp.]
MYFVCRWREQSPFGKRVVTVPDVAVLDWFRRGWCQDDPRAWIEGELGGHVYGLDSIFQEAGRRNLPSPDTVDELRELVREHLWVEGDDQDAFIRLSEHALRVRTDDDEVDLAYYFIDDQAVAASPDRLAFLVYDAWPLPVDAAAPGACFDHGVPVRTVSLGPAAAESVFSVRLCWRSPDIDRNLDLAGAIVFPGLTLPDLATRLGRVDDAGAEGWPYDARLLRALVGAAEQDIGPALQRYAQLPGHDPSPASIDLSARHVLDQPLLPRPIPKQSNRSLIRLDTHIAQVARYIDDFFGFDQWLLFDTRWAATHPDLARSLLRYTAHWDPYET